MHDTFLTLLQDRAHWEFELFLMILFDGIVAGILWPFVRLHWRHHIDRDRRELGPKWKRRVGEVTEDDSNTWTNAGPVSPRFDDLPVTHQSSHLPMREGKTIQFYQFKPAEAEKPEKTMDTPIGGGW